MAKRKRLTPAKIDTQGDTATDPALETKSTFPRYPLGVAPKARTFDPPKARPPIADVAQDASASAALTEIAQTLTDARSEGRLIQRLPLDAITDDYLVRDRIAVDDDEMESLRESLRQRGQQTAIEVSDLGGDRYGLISGWRRVQALRALQAEDPALDTVLAIVRQPDDAAAAYLAMVEENEIRVGLSYYERARIVARAVDQGVYKRDRVALAALFHAASRPKRSKIGAFVRIVRALDDHLRFPTALTERTGLALAQALEGDATTTDRVIAALTANPPDTAAAEASLLAGLGAGPATPKAPAPVTPAKQPARSDVNTGADDATAANGLFYKDGPDGTIVVSGAPLSDAKFRARLIAVLTKMRP